MRWRVDVAISSNHLSRIMRPTVTSLGIIRMAICFTAAPRAAAHSRWLLACWCAFHAAVLCVRRCTTSQNGKAYSAAGDGATYPLGRQCAPCGDERRKGAGKLGRKLSCVRKEDPHLREILIAVGHSAFRSTRRIDHCKYCPLASANAASEPRMTVDGRRSSDTT